MKATTLTKPAMQQAPGIRPPRKRSRHAPCTCGDLSPHHLPAILAEPPFESSRKPRERHTNTPHFIDAEGLPWVWSALGLDPQDYAHLDPAVANAILELWPKMDAHEWQQYWQAMRHHGLEGLFVAVYEEYFAYHGSLDGASLGAPSADATTLAILHDMALAGSRGMRRGCLALVQVGSRVGLQEAAACSYASLQAGVVQAPGAGEPSAQVVITCI